MGRFSGRSGITNLTYALPGGLPVFRAVTSWRYGKAGFLRLPDERTTLDEIGRALRGLRRLGYDPPPADCHAGL